MKKNGFIATSLIYSFFLIFITLFLTIVADYLQNKVSLNVIEKSIKDEINNSMGLKDFEVGDMVILTDDFNTTNVYSQWVVANINYISKKIVLYSYDFKGDLPSSFTISKPDLRISNFDSDIEFAYKNNTYYNKIIYTFSTNKGAITSYGIVDNNGNEMLVSLSCNPSGTGGYDFNTNCIMSGSSGNKRKRIEFNIGDTRYNSQTDDAGTILLDVV